MIAYILTISVLIMAVANWGLLTKSVDDPETIEEAIDRIVGEHNDDETAHLETGQSLQSHKASEIIDHLAQSVYRDKLAFDRFQLETYFESIDGFGKSAGTALNGVGQAALTTTATTNNTQYLYAYAGDANEDAANLNYNPHWLTRVKLGATSNNTVYITSGDPGGPQGYGFKIVDGTLYAYHVEPDDDEQLTEITGLTLTNWHTYEVFVTYGEKIEFYVDKILRVTHTTDLPVGGIGNFIYYQIKTTANATKYLWVQYLIFDCDYS